MFATYIGFRELDFLLELIFYISLQVVYLRAIVQ